MVKPPTPSQPSQSEVEDHELGGHILFRSWCRHCIRGRGQALPHRTAPECEHSTPVISWDYGFLGSVGKVRDHNVPGGTLMKMRKSRDKALFYVLGMERTRTYLVIWSPRKESIFQESPK